MSDTTKSNIVTLFEANKAAIDKEAISSNNYKQAIDAFKEGLFDYAVNDKEKVVAYADFMAKTFLGMYQTNVEAALRMVGLEAEIEGIRYNNANALLQVAKTRQEINQSAEIHTLSKSRMDAEERDIEAAIDLKRQQETQLDDIHIKEIERMDYYNANSLLQVSKTRQSINHAQEQHDLSKSRMDAEKRQIEAQTDELIESVKDNKLIQASRLYQEVIGQTLMSDNAVEGSMVKEFQLMVANLLLRLGDEFKLDALDTLAIDKDEGDATTSLSTKLRKV